MRGLFFIFVVMAISCSSQQQKTNDVHSKRVEFSPNIPIQSKKEICWTGTLNQKIPIFLHYQFDSNLVVGEVIYLNTKNRKPIQIIGNIEEDKTCRLLEFDKTGNITGIFSGKITENSFNGSWFSPKTRKKLSLDLIPKDTLMNSPSIGAASKDVFGTYHYQYSTDGYNGVFEFNKVQEGKAALYILSLTNVERGPNIAEVERDTISFEGSSFKYKIPGSDDCEFRVKFYKDFVYIKSKAYCGGWFGFNADIDGIYVKTE